MLMSFNLGLRTPASTLARAHVVVFMPTKVVFFKAKKRDASLSSIWEMLLFFLSSLAAQKKRNWKKWHRHAEVDLSPLEYSTRHVV